MRFVLVASLIFSLVGWASPVAAQHEPTGGWPRVCYNRELLKAIRIIHSACDEARCKPETLRQLDTRVDKPTLLAALRDTDLKAVHVFFEYDRSDVAGILHWSEWKRDQLASLKYIDAANSVVYVLGQASHTTGPSEYNFDLSQKRMNTIMKYLQDVLHVKCQSFRGGWLGYDIFQLKLSDAELLQISADDFDNNQQTLNQAVHVFVFPCADLL